MVSFLPIVKSRVTQAAIKVSVTVLDIAVDCGFKSSTVKFLIVIRTLLTILDSLLYPLFPSYLPLQYVCNF